MVHGFSTSPRRALARAHGLSTSIGQKGRRAVALGAVLLAVSTATVWATANTPPHITSLTASAALINEGQSITVNGTFADPDATDLHTIFIYWGDGNPGQAEKIQLPAGQLAFQVSHTYQDNLAPTTIKVGVGDRQRPPETSDNTDGEGRDTGFLPIEVKNVAPHFAPGITVTKVPRAPGKVLVDGSFTDPGADGWKVLANFGDGLPNHQLFPPLPDGVSRCTVSGHQFHCEHQYNVPQFSPPKTYPIKLGVEDDDGGTGTFQTSVQIP
jgi:hypothetical protein